MLTPRIWRQILCALYFFFSSRRRYTRWPRDWSSDVCSSDLETDVLAGFRVVEQLAEHLDTGDGGLDGLVVQTDDFNLVVHVELTALNTAGDDGSTTGDREDVFDRHEERLVDVTDRVRDVLVDGVHEVFNRLDPLRVAFEGLEAGDANHGGVVTGEVLGGEEFTNFHLDEVEELFVVHHVALVQRNEEVGNAHLAGEEHVLAGLRHRTVGRGDDEDRPVHLRGTGDHVLHVVSVTGGVDVCIVALLGLVLNVRGGDGDTTLARCRSAVHLVERAVLGQVGVLVSENLGDRRRQGGLPVVDVSDGSDVYVRFSPLELGLSHLGSSWNLGRCSSSCCNLLM